MQATFGREESEVHAMMTRQGLQELQALLSDGIDIENLARKVNLQRQLDAALLDYA